MTVGAIGLALDHGTIALVILLSIPITVGMVAIFIATTNVIVLTVAPEELGIQTGINQTFRNLGSAIGPVVATSILASFLTTNWVQVGPGIFLPFASPANVGFVWAMLLAAALALAGFALSFGLRNLERMRPRAGSS
jgi:MFS family permease